MEMSWFWQIVLLVVFFANFALEALVGTTGRHEVGWFRFYHRWIFRWLWSGPVYFMPLLAQPRLPTQTGTWWAGVIGDTAHLRTGEAWAGAGWMDVVGWIGFAVAWALWIWAFIPKHPWAMQPPETICRSGPYRWLRHPINLGWLFFVAGWYAAWGGLHSLMLAPLYFAFFVLEAFWEERFLLERDGNNEAYREYRNEVGMFFPTFSTSGR